LKEASAINKSLSALGNVIKALVDVADGKDRHVPYRDSKLTFLLKEALGGKARCTLLACVSPAAGQVEETLSTLKFAQRAKLVKVTASKNEEAVGSVAELAAEVTRLRNMLSEGTGEGADRARLRANDLELHIARANRVAAATARAAAQETEKLSGRLVEVQELASRLDKNLQSTKMVLRLKEARLSKGTKSVENTDSEEMESLRKMAECPPEVIRMRIEMQQLRHQIEQLEAENGIHPAKGKMIQLEKEMKELRAVRLEEGELVAQTVEDRAAADAAREETEHVNEILEAQRNASERAAALSEDAAANADAARAEAALAQVNAEAKQKIAEENMFRVQATFDEQKCVMEEMFGQIEKLDALRTRLEQQLAEANLASEAARVEAAETKEVLTAITDAKNVIEAEAAAAAQRHDQECARKDDELIRMKAAHRIEISEIEKSHAALLVATTEIREGEMEKLVASHDKMVTEMKDVHTKEVAASAETHSIDLAKQRTDIENLAHEALMKEKQSHDGRVAKLEAAHAQAIQVKMKEHRDTIAELSANHDAAFVSKHEEYKAAIADVAANADARAAAAAAELEVMESAHKAAVAEAATAHLTELNEVRAAHDESIETLRRAHGQELEEMKSKHAEQLTDQRLKSSEEAEKHESALSDVQKTVETLKAELLDVKATHEVEVADLETMHKDEMKKLEDGYKGEIVKVQSAATEIASAREASLANQVATAEKASELASLEAAETIAAMEIAKTAAMEELKATHAAALDAAKQSCASALQAADAEKILAVQAVKDSASSIAEDIHQKHDAALVEVEARVKMAAAKSAEEDMATALNAAKKDKVAALQALEISHEKALHSLHAELNDRLHTEMDTLIAQAENEKIAAVAAAMESNASDAVEKLEKAHAEEIRELEMKHAEVLAKAAEEQALAVSIKLKEAIKEAESRAHSTLTKQRETLESAAKAGMRAQEKMLASAEEKLASMKAELSSATEAGKAAEARAAKVEAAAKAAVIAAKAQLDSVREENAKEHALELEALRASLEEEAKLGHRSAASSDGKVLELQSIIARLSAELAAAKNSIDVAEPPKTASKRGRSKCAATPEAKRDDTFEKSVTRSAAKGRKPLSSRSTNAGAGEDDSSAELVPTKRAKSTPKAAVLLDESL
jgi:kinesin family protein 15